MGQALDSVEVARLCACWAEACLGARLATEAVEAAKRCLRSLPEPWPPKWRFLLAKAHLTRGDVRPARAVLSSLIAECSREDDKTLYEKWLEVAGWDGVDEVTALARKTFNAKDDTNIDKMNKFDRGVPGPFGDLTPSTRLASIRRGREWSHLRF